MVDSGAEITKLLRAAASGERDDVDALIAVIYDDLRRLAASHLRRVDRDWSAARGWLFFRLSGTSGESSRG